MAAHLLPALIGLALAGSVVLLASALGFLRERSFLPTLLIVIASYYPLFAAMASADLLIPVLIACGFASLAVLGSLTTVRLVAIGILLHAGFDLLHLGVLEQPGMPAWWPALCGGFDLLLGIVALRMTTMPATQNVNV